MLFWKYARQVAPNPALIKEIKEDLLEEALPELSLKG